MSNWQARFALDLNHPTAKNFEQVVRDFNDWNRDEPLKGPVELSNDFHVITPELAEQLLRRNRAGANRKASLSTVLYYATQMKAGDWPVTGESLIFTVDGTLIDGQHRLWACYLSGVPFTTFVVANVPVFPDLFAYIDNGRSRTATTALQTAGLDGVSGLVAKVLDAAYNYENGLYTATATRQHAKFAPIWYLRKIADYPNARAAARLAVSEFEAASELLDKDVVAFALMAITDRHGEHTAEQFFSEFIGEIEAGPDSPVLVLRDLMEKDHAKTEGGMKKNVKLGNLILAFNAWLKGETLKRRWALQAHEDFPAFVEAEPSAQAAE